MKCIHADSLVCPSHCYTRLPIRCLQWLSEQSDVRVAQYLWSSNTQMRQDSCRTLILGRLCSNSTLDKLSHPESWMTQWRSLQCTSAGIISFFLVSRTSPVGSMAEAPLQLECDKAVESSNLKRITQNKRFIIHLPRTQLLRWLRRLPQLMILRRQRPNLAIEWKVAFGFHWFHAHSHKCCCDSLGLLLMQANASYQTNALSTSSHSHQNQILRPPL